MGGQAGHTRRFAGFFLIRFNGCLVVHLALFLLHFDGDEGRKQSDALKTKRLLLLLRPFGVTNLRAIVLLGPLFVRKSNFGGLNAFAAAKRGLLSGWWKENVP